MSRMLESSNPNQVVIPTLSTPADGSLEAFFEACESGDLARVTELVQGQSRPEDYLSRGLLTAAVAGQAAIARYLLEHGARLEPGPIPVIAARGRSLAVFQVLKEYGWNVETEGYKVLPSVVQNESLVRWLLENGADPTRGKARWNQSTPQDDRNAGAALNAAAGAGEIAVFDLLLESGARIETSVPLHMAAGSSATVAKAIAMMSHLLELGLDVNGLDDIQGPYGIGTPLHHAFRNRAVEVAQFLLEQGADQHKKNQWGYTPAEEAIKKNATDFIRMFEAANSPNV